MRLISGMLAALALLVGLSTTGSIAATFTSDHCTDGCGPQVTGFATITGTQVDANTVDVTITPLNGNKIIGSGLYTFTFNLTTNVDITYSNFSAAGFTVIDGFGGGLLSQHAGAIHNDGLGVFEYGIDKTVNGGGNGLIGPLSFRITGAGLTLDDFAELSTIPPGDLASFMALDIISGTTGKTGLVDCCSVGVTPFDVPGETPIPGALWLFGSVLGLGAMLRSKRKRSRGLWDDLPRVEFMPKV